MPIGMSDFATAANKINRAPYELKAISRDDQTISSDAAGTIPLAEIEQLENGVSISDGVITFEQAGTFRAQIQLNFDNAANTTIEGWAEYWDGDSWELLADSGSVIETSQANEGNFLFESLFTVSSGMQMRFKVRIDAGSASLDSLTLSNGIVVPSVTYIVHEVK